MSIEVGTYPIQYFAWKPIVFPLLSVEFQHTLIHQIFTVLKKKKKTNTTKSLPVVSGKISSIFYKKSSI